MWDAVEMGFSMVEESEKCLGGRGLAAVAVVRVSVYQLARKHLQLVLSHLRPTSFLEVGWWRCDCTMFDGCLDVWGSNRCIEEGKIGGGGKKEKTATRVPWEALYTWFQDHTTGRTAFTTLL